MKKLIIVFAIIASIMGGCKSKDKETGNGAKENPESHLNYDDMLETKSIAKVDTTEFRKVMNSVLPSKRILELFGGGYQVFYLGLIIEPGGNTYAKLAPEAGWWVNGLGEMERMLFKENLEIANEYAIIPDEKGEYSVVSLKRLFYFPIVNIEKAFIASPGTMNGEKVRSVKIFQIDVTIDNAKNIIRPWSIKEVDIARFRPHINTNLNREDYAGFFPSVLKEDFKFISSRIEFPKEAVSRGVRGRVLVKLYFEGNGDYAGYQLLKGLGYGCDEAVINAVQSLKPKCYPSGQRSTVLVPFNFGPTDKTPIDLSVNSFEYNPGVDTNPLKLSIVNKVKPVKIPATKYSIYVYLNDQLIFFDRAAVIPPGEFGTSYYFGGKSIKLGKHTYSISIDPENILNDINRKNNTVSGVVEVK